MKTKKFLFAAIAAEFVMGLFCSCSQNDDIVKQGEGIEQGQSKLKLATRTEGNAKSPKEARIYLFDKFGDCTHIIETNDKSDSKTIVAAAGKHKLIAVGGDNLSHYILPDLEHANDTSIIKLKEGKALNNLLLKTEETDLNEGETTNVSISMSREVICIKDIKIEKIPTDVTRTELTIAPMYKNIRLNGAYTNETDTIRISLVRDESTGNWTNNSDSVFSLPSKGNPIVMLKTVSKDAIKEYSYQNSKPLTKNHYVRLNIVYNEGLKTYLSTLLSEPNWEGTENVDYEFSEENVINEEYKIPLEGKTYNKFYVVSADADAKTAVLLRKTGKTNIGSESAMIDEEKTINKPEGATTDHWRLPTLYECRKILKNCDIFYSTEENSRQNNYQIIEGKYYFMEDSKVGVVQLQVINGERVLTNFIDTGYSEEYIYRPVIDIKY